MMNEPFDINSMLPAAIPLQPDGNGALAVRRLLLFQLAEALYGLDAAFVREVARLAPLTIVPGAPPYLYGTITWKERAIPVVNLTMLLAEGSVSLAPLERVLGRPSILIVQQGAETAGLLVDAAGENYELDAAAVRPLMHGRLVSGEAAMGGRRLLLINVAAIFARLTQQL